MRDHLMGFMPAATYYHEKPIGAPMPTPKTETPIKWVDEDFNRRATPSDLRHPAAPKNNAAGSDKPEAKGVWRKPGDADLPKGIVIRGAGIFAGRYAGWKILNRIVGGMAHGEYMAAFEGGRHGIFAPDEFEWLDTSGIPVKGDRVKGAYSNRVGTADQVDIGSVPTAHVKWDDGTSGRYPLTGLKIVS